jgi:hypothetical protein
VLLCIDTKNGATANFREIGNVENSYSSHLGIRVAAAETLTTPSPLNTRFILPGEGRSIYWMEAPGTFYGGTDERGYPTGDPQNPRTGG